MDGNSGHPFQWLTHGGAGLRVWPCRFDLHHPASYDINHSQAAPCASRRKPAATSAKIQKARTPTATPQMKLTIPSDQQLGSQIESIVRTIATVIAFVYAAGFTFGQALHWLSANFTQLHRFLIHDATPSSPAFVSNSNADSRSNNQRPSTSKRTNRGFA